MKAHQRSLDKQQAMSAPSADPTAQPGDDQGMPQSDPSQGAQPQDLSALQQGFDSVLQAVQQGQAPDPQTAKALCEFLEQFSGEEQSGSEEQGEPQPEYE